MKICFFVRLQDKTREERLATLHRVEFYAQDIKILQDLGHEVILATRFSEVPWNADFYFCWWWTFSFIPILKAKLSGKPLIITGTFDHILPKGLINYYDRPLLQRLWLRCSLWLADANIFVSECEYKSVTEMLGCRKPYYSPHIIYTDEYKPSADPKREEELIFTVSWLYEFNAKRKGIFEIIRAAALVKREYPSIKFCIAGEKGSAYPTLTKLVEELKLEDTVLFLGLISKDEKINYLQKCTLYLQPTRFEGFGLAILEAMSCGSPVITSAVGAVPEVVGNVASLVDCDDIDGMANAIIRLLKDKRLAQEAGHLGRERAVNLFSYDRRLQDLKQIIATITKS
jgi:glycosyltransferase involved in cell wall biosynthesis